MYHNYIFFKCQILLCTVTYSTITYIKNDGDVLSYKNKIFTKKCYFSWKLLGMKNMQKSLLSQKHEKVLFIHNECPKIFSNQNENFTSLEKMLSKNKFIVEKSNLSPRWKLRGYGRDFFLFKSYF